MGKNKKQNSEVYINWKNLRKQMKIAGIFWGIIALVIIGIGFVSAAQQTVGPFQSGEQITLIQTCGNCTYCNVTSLIFPNGTKALGQVAMVQDGSEYTYDYTLNETVFGDYIVNGKCDVDGIDTVWAYNFEATSTGKPTPDGIPSFYGVLVIIIFGVSVFFLFFSMKLNEVGPKIFFMVASFIFLLATLMTAYQLSAEFNLSAALNSTTGALVFVLAMVLLIIFLYILIRQTVVILDMYKVKKGLAWPGGAGVTGYKMNNWQY